MDHEYAERMYHWLFLAQEYPVPETLIGAAPTFYLDHLLDRWSVSTEGFDEAALAEYRRRFSRPSVIRASCADYRAGLRVDAVHDRESRTAGDRIDRPLLVLWGAGSGTVSFDPAAIWREWATDVRGRGIDCGHFLPEEAPDETLAAVERFHRSGLAPRRDGAPRSATAVDVTGSGASVPPRPPFRRSFDPPAISAHGSVSTRSRERSPFVVLSDALHSGYTGRATV